MTRILTALLLLAPGLYAQTPVATVTTKSQPITTTAPVIAAGTTLCTSPKNGGACKTAVAILLKPLSATVPGQTAPVVFVPLTFNCKVQTLNGAPDLTKPLVCTVQP